MPENANHHYLPQYYFRQFNGGRRSICALLFKDGRVIPKAPIKGQCARHLFYGTPEIERQFGQLEGQHAAVYRALIEAATTGDTSSLSNEHFFLLLQAVAFQRARTLVEVEKTSPSMEAMFLHLFREYVIATKPPEQWAEFLGPIDRGEVAITESSTVTAFRHIRVAIEGAPLLVDLLPSIIRNHSDYPFIFSDSPVVFYNSYYRQITDRGVLGVQTPGLQIFLPVTSTLQLMLYDRDVYSGRCRDGLFCDITERGDVSQLNALQLHHSGIAVYFGDSKHADYVQELYRAHNLTKSKPEATFRVRNDLRANGEHPDGGILHTFEPHLNYHLSLSFVHCDPVPPREFSFRHRSPDLVEEHERRLAERERNEGHARHPTICARGRPAAL